MSLIDPGLKKAMARNLKIEQKHAEKDAARLESHEKNEKKRVELKGQKEKWTKTITSTAARKRAREKAAYDGENLADSSEPVWKQKGTEVGSAACGHCGPSPATQRTPPSRSLTPASRPLTPHPRARSHSPWCAGKYIPAPAALFALLTFLKERTDYAEASLGEIRDGTGIDLNVHASMLDALRENIKVDAVEEPGVPLRLRYLPAHGVRDRASLLHLLQHTYPGAADGHVEALPRSELPVR